MRGVDDIYIVGPDFLFEEGRAQVGGAHAVCEEGVDGPRLQGVNESRLDAVHEFLTIVGQHVIWTENKIPASIKSAPIGMRGTPDESLPTRDLSVGLSISLFVPN